MSLDILLQVDMDKRKLIVENMWQQVPDVIFPTPALLRQTRKKIHVWDHKTTQNKSQCNAILLYTYYWKLLRSKYEYIEYICMRLRPWT